MPELVQGLAVVVLLLVVRLPRDDLVIVDDKPSDLMPVAGS